jgi:urease accessory protein
LTVGTNLSFDVLNLADAGFPTGAHGHSGGLEYAIQAGWVYDGATLDGWCRRSLDASVWTLDLRAAVKAWHGVPWRELNADLASFRTSRVQREASAQVGRSFLRSVASCYGDRAAPLPEADDPDAVQFPVAWGAVFRLLGLPVEAMAQTLVFGVVRQWTQVAVRIVPLGQKEAFAVQTALLAGVPPPPTGPETVLLPLESRAFGLELAGLGMETLERKYFRS